MRIAMIGQKGIPAASGGVERHVEALARELGARGHEVVVYCRRWYCGQVPEPALPGVSRMFRPSIATRHLDAASHSLLCTLDAIRRRPDVVHYHGIGPGGLAALSRACGLRTVVTVHALDWRRAKWGRGSRVALRAGERLSARAAHRLIAVSPVLGRYLEKTYGVPTVFVPNAVDPLPRPDPGALERWRLSPGGFVLAVGRLVAEKGFHLLIDAMRDVPSDYRLVIAGGGDWRGEYEQELRARADDRTVFTGEVGHAELAALYRGAALFVLPSTVEGMSVALLEAMQAGAPALVSDILENTSVAGDAAATHRSGDAGDLGARLRELLAAPHRREQLARRAVATAAAYRWDQVAEQLERVYTS